MGVSREIELEGWNKELSEKCSRLTTHLDICRMSLEEAVKQNEEYETAFNNSTKQLEEINKDLSNAEDLIHILQEKEKKLVKALEDIAYITDPVGGESDDMVYDIAIKALKK